jgi:hypothetical protein
LTKQVILDIFIKMGVDMNVNDKKRKEGQFKRAAEFVRGRPRGKEVDLSKVLGLGDRSL